MSDFLPLSSRHAHDPNSPKPRVARVPWLTSGRSHAQTAPLEVVRPKRPGTLAYVLLMVPLQNTQSSMSPSECSVTQSADWDLEEIRVTPCDQTNTDNDGCGYATARVYSQDARSMARALRPTLALALMRLLHTRALVLIWSLTSILARDRAWLR